MFRVFSLPLPPPLLLLFFSFFFLVSFSSSLSSTSSSSVLSVEAAYCGRYSSSASSNEKAFPLSPSYSHKGGDNFFGAPVICDALAPSIFYVPQNGTSKEEVEQQAFGSGLGLGALETNCRVAATRFLCASAFRKCDFFPLSPSLPNFLVFPLPRPPCRSVCEDFKNACEPLGVSVPDCKSSDQRGVLYPKRTFTFVIEGVGNFELPCENSPLFSDFSLKEKDKENDNEDSEKVDNLRLLDPVVCPWPLEYNKKHKDSDPPCQPVCPHSNVYSETEWRIIMRIKLWGGVASLILDAWTIITQITIVEKRIFPANLGIAAAVCHLMWMVAFVVSGSMGDDPLCKDHFTNSTCYDHRMCGVEAAAITWLSLLIAMIWLLISLQLFMLVVMGRKNRELRKFYVPAYLVIGIFPTVLVVIEFSVAAFQYNTGIPFCWFRSRAWQWSAYWWPIAVALILVVISSVITLTSTFRLKRKFMSIGHILKRHAGLLTFLVCFTWVYGFFVINKIWLEAKAEDWQNDVINTVKCNSDSGGLNNCRWTDRYKYSTFVTYTLLACCSGVFIFLSWGCSQSYLGHWKRMLPILFTGQWRRLCNLELGTDRTMSSGGSFRTSGKSKDKASTRSKSTGGPSGGTSEQSS